MSSHKREIRRPEMDGAKDLTALRAMREKEQGKLSSALSSSPVIEITESLRELHDALAVQAIKFAEAELARMGLGAPPVPYAYLLFGSGGRSEQTFSSDQDSGIVFADPRTPAEADACKSYFPRLAETAVRNLTDLGYPPCDGNVIASNPDWCLSLKEWQVRMDGWFGDPSWEHVRYLLIIADARPVAGDFGLAERLKDRYDSDRLKTPVILRRMMENTLRHKVLVGIFGQLLPERYGENAGGIDIKYGAYIPMVNVFRLMAVQAGIRETGTLDRIAALCRLGLLTMLEAEEALSAFTLLLRLRLLTAMKSEDGQWIGSGKLPKERLTKEMEQLLKKTLKFGKKMQRRVEREWKDRFGGR